MKDRNENQSKLFRSNFNFDKKLDSYFQKVNFKKELFKQKGIFLLGKEAQTVKYFLQGSVIAHFNYYLFQLTSTKNVSNSAKYSFFYADLIYLGIVGLPFSRTGGGQEEGRGEFGEEEILKRDL